ncbi:MAG: hypothetical protein ABI895_26670 [Deltaproteobacteria bacterium]
MGWLPKVVRCSVLAALCAPLLLTVEAAAQEDADAAETAAARSIALEGIKLADAGHCDEAIDKLARAEKLHHAPVVLGRLGECQIAQGRLVEGTENLRKVLREALPAEPSSVLVRARERAAAVLERAKGRIGALNIVVRNGPRDSAELRIVVDGQPMNVALLDADRPADPGEHVIEATAPGYFAASARVSVSMGERQSVILSLEPDPKARVAASTASAPQGSAASSETTALFTRVPPPLDSSATASNAGEPAERNLTGAYVAWAAGGVAVAAGSIFGLLAFQGKSDLDEQCADNLCPDSSADRLDSARRDSTLATVLMAAGGVGLGLGTVFYFSAGPSEDSEQDGNATSRSGRKQALQGRAWIGLGQVGLSGDF